MIYTAKTIAEYLGGEVEGDPETEINNITKIEEGIPGSISFLANMKYEHFIYETRASAVIVNKTFTPSQTIPCSLIRVDDAYSAFASLLRMVEKTNKKRSGKDKRSFVHKKARYGKNVYIGAFAYIDEHAIIGNNVEIHPQVFIGSNVSIGDNTIIHPGVTIYHNCKIGSNCIVHSGTVIGSDGFGFAPEAATYKKIPQIGNVVIEDNVEIGSNCSIDRATVGSTLIRKGVKIDNLIQIAHNVEIGENTVICAQAGIAGSTKIGRESMIGGQVGIIGHLTLADGTKIAAQSGIGHSVTEKNKILQGSPAFDIHTYQKSYVLFRKLPDLYTRINELEKTIKKIKGEQ